MTRWNAHEALVMFLALGVSTASARALGEVARRLNRPSVAGEFPAGLLPGPAALGCLAPARPVFIFPGEGPNAVVLHGFTSAAIIVLTPGPCDDETVRLDPIDDRAQIFRRIENRNAR